MGSKGRGMVSSNEALHGFDGNKRTITINSNAIYFDTVRYK